MFGLKIRPSLLSKMMFKKLPLCVAALLYSATLDYKHVAPVNLQQRRGSDRANALLSYQKLSTSLFVCAGKFYFYTRAKTKFQNHSNILHTSNLRRQRLRANKVVGVFACGSVGAHVAEGRSLAEYRLEEVDVLINVRGEGRGG